MPFVWNPAPPTLKHAPSQVLPPYIETRPFSGPPPRPPPLQDYYTLQFMDPSIDTSPIAPALAEFFDDVLDKSISELNFKSIVDGLGAVLFRWVGVGCGVGWVCGGGHGAELQVHRGRAGRGAVQVGG